MPAFTINIQLVSEIIATVTGLAGVWLTSRQIIWCWPVALINVVLSFYVFFVEQLYQDALLQAFYFVMTLYGWYNWLYGGENHSKLGVTNISRLWLAIYLVSGTILMFLSGFLFKKYTHAAVPYWDAASLIWGIIGTIWMTRKWIEHWLLWVVIDIICTGIYIYKGLYFFTAQYFIFTLLAVYGFIAWNKDLKSQKAQ